METLDFRTDAEKRRAEKAEVISAAFRKFKESTGYSDCRIITAMAQSRRYGYTTYNSIRDTLRKTNTI